MTKSARRVMCVLLTTFLFACTCYSQDQSGNLSAQVDDFATVLITTKSPQERDSLLVSKKDLVTPDLRKSIIRQGNTQMMSGQYRRAFDIYSLAQKVSQRIDDREGVAAASLNIGTIYYFQGDFAQALEHYQVARRLSLETQNKYEAAKALSGIGLIQKEQQETDAALKSFELALKEFTALGDNDEVAKALNSIGAIYYSQSDYPAATKALLRSAELKPDPENKLRTADAFYMQGDYESASDYYATALKEFEERLDPAGMIGSLTGAANSAYYVGNYDEALNLFRRNIAVQDRVGDESGVATSLQGVGNVYRAQGDYARAVESYLKSLERADRSAIKMSTATTFGSIGLVRSLQGANLDAIAYFSKSLAEFEVTGDNVGMARMLSHIGNSQYAQGDYTAALASYAKALKLREAMNDPINQAYLQVGIGTVYFTTEEYPSAIDSYSKALTIFEAAANYETVADVLTRLADVYLQKGDPTQSLAHADRATTLARQIDSSDTLWYARLVAGKAQLKLDQTAQAIQSFNEAVSIVEALRERPFSGEAAPERSTSLPHLALVDLFIKQNKPAEAFSHLEQAKIQSLLTLLKRGRALSVKGLSAAELALEQKLTREITSLETQINREAESRHSTPARRATLAERRRKALVNYGQFRRSTYAVHPGLRVARGELTPAMPEELQRVVRDKETAFLEYVVTENNIYLFVATADTAVKGGTRKPLSLAITFKAYPLPAQSTILVQKVIAFGRSLAAKDEKFSEAARSLFTELLAPASAQLAGKSKLIIAPDAFLWRVPFEALQPDDQHFLIDQASISYTHSLAALREMTKPRPLSVGKPKLGLVVFASPQLSNDQQGRVGQSANETKEIEVLRAAYGESQTRVASGVEASDELVKSESVRAGLLHFASPSVLDDTSPMFSFTALTPDLTKQSDGLLLSREVINLRTNARTVFVANVVVNNDQIANGEALNGLAWAWFVAGSPSTIVGRWTVQSPGSNLLMSEFYSRIKPSSQRPSTAGALQGAMLKLRHSTEYQHPYYWANFALIGDAR